ncbi:MAG: (d)CMP kinase [Bdellovibrionota bacterium]
MSLSTYVLTIDGPAASGKSTVSRQLSQRFGCPWVSTGAFYRGLAYAALRMNIELDKVDELVKLCESNLWEVRMTPARTLVFFQGENVTDQIAHEDVGSFASRISSHPPVRASLLAGQRACARPGSGLVAEGRDCGTVVFPNANVKIYLTADQDKRAARRAREQGAEETEILAAQKVRDAQDSQRKASPMQIPEDALVVDTSEMDLNEVVDLIEKHIRGKIQVQ